MDQMMFGDKSLCGHTFCSYFVQWRMWGKLHRWFHKLYSLQTQRKHMKAH